MAKLEELKDYGMNEVPERIWAYLDTDPLTDKKWDAGEWYTEDVGLDGDEVEYIRVDIHEARIKELECEISHLNEMRPFWAEGYSSDSVAAQTATSALSSIWRCLGVKDQTACMYALEELKKHKEDF
jgi:hypothetical protein